MGRDKRELEVEMVDGRCELCGFEAKVMRCSRPVEGYKIYIKDGTLVFEGRKV